MSRIGPSGVHRGVRSGTRPTGRPYFSDYPLDTGIRPESNRRSGGPGEVPVGTVSVPLGNPGKHEFGSTSIALLERSGADSVVSVSEVPAHFNPMRALRVDDRGIASLFVTGQPVRHRLNRRQDMPTAWTMNGAIYLFRARVLDAAEPSLYGDRKAAYVMPPAISVSIDSLDDWTEAEHALRLRTGHAL